MKKHGKKLGVFDLFSLGFGAIVGVGWSVTLNNLMIMGGGPVPTTLGFVLAVVLLVPIALCFAELTPAMPVAGGVTAYAYRAFGSGVSFVGGWFVVLAYVSLLPWEAIAINDIVSFIFPMLRAGQPLYTLAGGDIHLPALLVGIGLSLIIIFINWRGVDFAAKFQSILTIVLIGCSVLSVVFLLLKFDATNLQPLYQSMPGKSHASLMAGILAITAVGPFYFSGFDTIPQGAEDIGANIKPKGLGKVIIGAVLSAGLFYLCILLSAGGAYNWTSFVGFERPALSNLLRAAYAGPLGEALFWVSLTGTLAGLFTTWNGFYIAGSRMLMGMARARFLPEFFLRQHPKYHTPLGGNIFCGVIMVLGPFLGVGLIDPLLQLGSAGFVIGWFLVCLSALRLRFTEPEMPRPYKMPGGKVMAFIACLSSAFLVVNSLVPSMPGYMGDGGMMVLVVWLALGALFFFSTRQHRKHVGEAAVRQSIFQNGPRKQA